MRRNSDYVLVMLLVLIVGLCLFLVVRGWVLQ